MNPRTFIILVFLAFASCSDKDAALSDKRAKKEFISILAYHAKPTITDGDLVKVASRVDSYRDTVMRFLPGVPGTFDLRVDLAWSYCKWDLYEEATIIIGDHKKKGKTSGSERAVLTYIALMTMSTNGGTYHATGGEPEQQIAMFGSNALLDMGGGKLEPAFSQIDSAIKNNADARLIFQSVALLDKLAAKQPDPTKHEGDVARTSGAALLIFLEGRSWRTYLELLKKHDTSFEQTMLFDDMLAIIGANAVLYTILNDQEKRELWFRKLKDIRDVLSEAHDNRQLWVEYLVDKVNRTIQP